MREILFRGKSEESGEWLYGLPDDEHHNADFPCILPDWRIHSVNDVPGSWGVDPKTVGQYTGLTDKNGKKIFEGDIVKYNEPFVLKSIGVVFFGEHQWNGNTNMGFYVKWVIAPLPDIMRTDIGFWCHERDIEVIGNIHDNPELLEGE